MEKITEKQRTAIRTLTSLGFNKNYKITDKKSAGLAIAKMQHDQYKKTNGRYGKLMKLPKQKADKTKSEETKIKFDKNGQGRLW